MQALVAPARLIANNAGVEGDVIIEKLMGQPFEMGYNAVRTLHAACDLHHFLERTSNCRCLHWCMGTLNENEVARINGGQEVGRSILIDVSVFTSDEMETLGEC